MKRYFYLLYCLMMCCSCYTSNAQIITTIAGNGIVGNSGNNGPAALAQMGQTMGVAADGAGNIFIIDNSFNVIRKINAAGIISVFAGVGPPGYGTDDIPATATTFNMLAGIATDAAGNVYVADRDGGRVRKINAAGIISNVAGGGSANPGNGGAATLASLSPSAVAVDALGNIYITDVLHSRLRKVNTAGIITTVAGNGIAGYNGDGIAATAAELWSPQGVCVDNAGNVYIAETDGNRIRKVNTAGIITTIAGTGAAAYSGDNGPATAAALNNPWSVANDGMGNIYIGQLSDRRVRKINAQGIIYTFAGNGVIGYSGDGGQAPLAKVNCPAGMAFHGPGLVYVSDFSNAVVRVVRDDTVRFTTGHMQSFVACASTAIASLLRVDDADAGQKLTWTLVAPPVHGTAIVTYTATATGGTVTPAGLSYTPATGYAGIDSFRVRVTDDMLADTTVVYVTVHPATAGTLAGPDTVCVGQTIVLIAPVGGGTWMAGNTNATVTASGVVTGANIGTVTISYTVINDCISSATIIKQMYVAGAAYCMPAALTVIAPADGLVLYPNPVRSVFTVSSSLSGTAIITDMLGRTVATFAITAGVPGIVRLDEPSGLYFLSLGQWRIKVVKE